MNIVLMMKPIMTPPHAANIDTPSFLNFINPYPIPSETRTIPTSATQRPHSLFTFLRKTLKKRAPRTTNVAKAPTINKTAFMNLLPKKERKIPRTIRPAPQR